GNTSSFGGNLLGGTRATNEIAAGRNGELTIFIGGPSAILTLPDIQQAVKAISPTVTLLENQGNGVWQANASLFFNRGVTLTLTLDSVKWLKLRSQATNIQPNATVTPNYHSFVAIRTYNGAILIDGVKITSWDPQKNDYDRDISNGRGYLLAKYDARMDIKNADLSYLGSADGESYGVAWRDINDADFPDVLRTRVTGTVLNSTFGYNYYGIYTFQASNMVFRSNKFHHNIGYGFDPHDFSHHFTIEDNEAYANGNHGFIISRGCNNFVFRRNTSHDNRYSVSDEDRKAHGFMLDPGSPTSRYPQAPSHDNLLENNAAWNNDGYGMRIVNSNDNTIRNNSFRDNLQGITVEQGGSGNLITGNTISGSQLYGVYLFGGADGNTISKNTISGSGKHGVYIKTGANTVDGNTISRNGSMLVGSGIAFLQETTLAAAAEDLQLPNTGISLAVADPSLLGSPEQASAVAGNIITGNTIADNADDGIELKNAINTAIRSNTVRANRASGIYIAVGSHGSLIENNSITRNLEYGIKANGSDVAENTWSANSIFANGLGGIVATGGANGGIAPPKITGRQGLQVSGTATPGTLVRIFSDMAQQGQFYEGSTTAGADGSFSFSVASAWHAPNLNATATDAAGNSSAFTYNSRTILPRLYLPVVRN
ncbi:MAG TPA: right-handed parallel beta-helix repeat-containing protein, partial [Roseiflexaceae bacterium]|nr:right-handed parallel beta-helix repeat-containing protein [Roseiflexaceae bacterium]